MALIGQQELICSSRVAAHYSAYPTYRQRLPVIQVLCATLHTLWAQLSNVCFPRRLDEWLPACRGTLQSTVKWTRWCSGLRCTVGGHLSLGQRKCVKWHCPEMQTQLEELSTSENNKPIYRAIFSHWHGLRCSLHILHEKSKVAYTIAAIYSLHISVYDWPN